MKLNLKTMFTVALLSVFICGTGLPHAFAKTPKKGWLGVGIEEMTPSMQEDYELGGRVGLLVTNVVPHSPAAKAGIEEDDVILSFDRHAVSRAGDLIKLVRDTAPGATVALKLFRDGEEKELQVTIEKRRRHRAHSFSWSGGKNMVIEINRPRLGVQVHDIGESLAPYFKVKAGAGVLVTEVSEDSPAGKAGLKAGDVIVKVDDEAISSSDDLIDSLEDYDDGDDVQIEYVRKGKTETVSVTLEGFEDEDIWIERGPGMHKRMRMKMPRLRHFDSDEMEFEFRRPGRDRKVI